MICAHAVSVDLKRFAGVESVDVSLNKGLASLKLKEGNAVTPEQLWMAIRKDGFTPKETRVIVKGMLDGAKLRVSGSNQLYNLAVDPGAPKAMAEVAKQTGKTVTVDGRLLPPKDFKSRVPILVRGLMNQRN